ncbi:unnamed protein product [Rodentolepis nana]|uniref:Ig-like domain-containing protein n=1 Tax=Rodentolepis nana TaxID=102285 RepID=A0A0R3TAY6_RODNA|nr:unnamed protein product [Rodentolepis nana]
MYCADRFTRCWLWSLIIFHLKYSRGQLDGGFGVFPFTEPGPVENAHETLNRRDETFNTGQGYGADLLGLQTDAQAVTQRDRLVNMLFKTYRTNERPSEKLDIPTEVSVNMKVLAIFSVDVRTMDYYIDALLRQTWVDPRLAWDHHEDFKNYTQPLVSPTLKDNIWTPDLFFRNGKDGYLHKMTLPNFLLRVHPNGEVLYSQKITMRFSCQMDLSTFPMDTQYCHMNIGSYGYTLSELKFIWREKEPVELQSNLQLSEFNTPTNFTTFDCTAQSSTSTGNYTCLMAEFTLKRQLGSYLVTTYIPNILIIMVSWLSFYVSVDAAPARVPLGLLSLLGLLTQASSITGNLPRVSYIKAIDLWLIFSIIFVIGVLVEYAIAITMLRQKRKETWRGDVESIVKEELTRWLTACEQGQMASIQGSGGMCGDQAFIQQQLSYFNDLDAFLTHSVVEETRTKKGPGGKKNRIPVAVESDIDAYSRFLFPTCYIMYNIFYWTYYLAIVKK